MKRFWLLNLDGATGVLETVSQLAFRLFRANLFPTFHPRLAPRAAFLRRFAAVFGPRIPLLKSRLGCDTDSYSPVSA